MAKMRPTVRRTHAREAWLVSFKSDRGRSANPLFAVDFAPGKVRARIVELQAQVAEQSDQRGQTSAAIRAEELRGQLRRFYVKQVETGDAGEFERMSIEELREYVYGQGKILATLDEKLPPKGPKGPVKH
jgi:hypothetical protein